MRMQCAACNEMFLSAVLQNPAVEPLEAEELYHIWMCKAESIPGRETLFQMLEEYCALVRRPVAGRSSTLFLDARNYVSEHLNEELRPADIANALGATENRPYQGVSRGNGRHGAGLYSPAAASRGQGAAGDDRPADRSHWAERWYSGKAGARPEPDQTAGLHAGAVPEESAHR